MHHSPEQAIQVFGLEQALIEHSLQGATPGCLGCWRIHFIGIWMRAEHPLSQGQVKDPAFQFLLGHGWIGFLVHGSPDVALFWSKIKRLAERPRTPKQSTADMLGAIRPHRDPPDRGPAAFRPVLGEAANPSVDVGILHPPELGLKVSRVTFAPSRTQASMELADALAADLLRQRELEVVAKGDVDLLTRAQEMAAPGAVDPALAAQLGRALGPGALLTVHVSRADIKHQDSSKDTKDKAGKVTATTRTHTTTLDFEATLQVVDGASGKVLGAAQIRENPSASTSSTGPSRRPMNMSFGGKSSMWRDRVLRLLPWTEGTSDLLRRYSTAWTRPPIS